MRTYGRDESRPLGVRLLPDGGQPDAHNSVQWYPPEVPPGTPARTLGARHLHLP